MVIKEAIQKLNEIDEPFLPTRAKRYDAAVVDTDLNKRLNAKIDLIAKALADAFREEHIDLDANLVADDIRRDCGLMGNVIGTDTLDDSNPFDAATKKMHDMGPIDTNQACQMLLNVPPHEFVAVFMNGLRRGGGLLPPGMDARRGLPHRGEPRQLPRGPRIPYGIHEAKKDYSYINALVDKYSAMLKDTLDKKKVNEDILVEKVQDLKSYFKRNLKDRFDELHLDEDNFLKIVALDPTYKEGSNAAGDYFEWLLRMITRKDNPMTYNQMMDIGHEWSDVLRIFDEYKHRNKLPADKKDIMQFKTFDELFSFMQSLGGDIKTDIAEGSSFKDIIKNIRGALIAVCGFKDEEIPSDIQKTEDCLTFCGENSKWELYKINSIWGAMLADTYGIDWGAGATWCTGGQYMYHGEPRKGMELYNSAFRHYNGYTNGYTLFFFTQKDNSVLRPKNKVQLQFSAESGAVTNIFHANDGPIHLTDEGTIGYTGWASRSTDDVDLFITFIQEEDLFTVVKNSPLGGCEAIRCMEIADSLVRGEPYVYDGRPIRRSFRQSIKEIVFPDNYDIKVKSNDANGNRVDVVGIRLAAFAGCTELETITLPASIVQIQNGAFRGCDKVHIIIPRYPDRPFRYPSTELDFYKEHAFYEDGEPVFK